MDYLLATPQDIGRIESLLCACGIAREDRPFAPPGFHALADALGTLAGSVGIEVFGPIGLLQSLAIAPAFRGHGFGRQLVEFAEQTAQARGVISLYLLTTSAADFFARLGYTPIPRSTAPQALLATLETGAIGSGGGYMVKSWPTR